VDAVGFGAKRDLRRIIDDERRTIVAAEFGNRSGFGDPDVFGEMLRAELNPAHAAFKGCEGLRPMRERRGVERQELQAREHGLVLALQLTRFLTVPGALEGEECVDGVGLLPDRTDKGDAIETHLTGLPGILRGDTSERMDGGAAFGLPALEDDLVLAERPARAMILLRDGLEDRRQEDVTAVLVGGAELVVIMALGADRCVLGPAAGDAFAWVHLETAELVRFDQFRLFAEDDARPEGLGDRAEKLFVVAAIPILADLDMKATEAGIEEAADLLGIPATVIGSEEHEILRGRGFRLTDEESFDEFEHERGVSRLGRRG